MPLCLDVDKWLMDEVLALDQGELTRQQRHRHVPVPAR